MGSVPDLYTTGDNDPELTPEQYYRHYLYCDVCGSFRLGPWTRPENLEAIESKRQKLGAAAWLGVPLLLVAVWQAFGPVFSALTLLMLLAGTTVVGVIHYYLWDFGDPRMRRGLRFVKVLVLWLPPVALVQWIASELWPPLGGAIALGLVIAGLLIARVVLKSKIEYLGLRCAGCRATYAYGTSFFTDLAANPRALTVDKVPRPLGSSPFERGAAVDYQPPKPPSQLPQ